VYEGIVKAIIEYRYGPQTWWMHLIKGVAIFIILFVIYIASAILSKRFKGKRKKKKEAEAENQLEQIKGITKCIKR